MMGTHNGKDNHITEDSPLPMNKIKSAASWGVKVKMERNTFIDFKSKTALGLANSIFGSNPYGSDYIPAYLSKDNTFINIEETALANLKQPDESWANLDDCGDFPCTAPLNVLINFRNTKWSGSKPSYALPVFDLIANNAGFAKGVKECVL